MSNLLNYTQYDFEDLCIQLQDRLKNRDSWKDIYRSSTGQMLIELLGYCLNLTGYYIERRAEESYIGTAKNISSVRNIVSLLSYIPKRKASSVGILTFTRIAPVTKIVFIPKYTLCESVDGVKFLTNEDAAIEKGSYSVSVNSIQGELVQKEITANGINNQEYLINDISVENSANLTNPTLRIVIDGVTWTQVTSFINSDSSSKHYRVINEMEGTVSIVFGDNINGLAPANGSKIVINYVKSDGLSGNATSGVITTVSSVIYDEDSSAVTVTVNNAGSFLGGDAEEDIEEIRYEAPRVFKTGDRAVTKEDFIAILENYAGVADANVWGENEEALAAGEEVDYEMLNKVKICLILQDWNLTDEDFEDILSAYLYNKSMIAIKYEFVVPVILYVIPVLNIKVATGYSMSNTQAEVEEVLADQFILGDTTKLGTVVKYSNVIAAVDNLASVAYCSMTLEIEKELDYSSAGYVGTLDALPIKIRSARLFVDDVYIVTDDGEGAFTAAGVTGTIDYTTGEVVIDIDGSPYGEVVIRYQQDVEHQEENIVPTFRQICQLLDVDVHNIVME
jgi:hypothetical protein